MKSRLWVTTLLVGLLGFVLLSTLEQSIRGSLQSRARELLGGDLALSSRRWMSDSELNRAREQLKTNGSFQETQVLEFYSMIAHRNFTPQLAELVVVDSEYPLAGELTRERSLCLPDDAQCVWSDAAFQIRWNLQAGKSFLKIGEALYRWGGKIERDTNRSLRGSSLAPRIFMSRAALAKTGLLRTGATFTVRHIFAFRSPLAETQLESLHQNLQSILEDPGVRIQIPQDASEDEGRLLRNIADYLGLASLVGLLLAFLGCSWMLRQQITEQSRNWAIYRVLSPSPSAADFIFWKQSLLAATISATLALVSAQLLWTLSAPLVASKLLMTGFLPLALKAKTILGAYILAFFTASFSLWPSLQFLKRQNLPELLRNPAILAQRSAMRAQEFLIFVFILWLTARWIAHSWRVASVFIGVMTLCAGLLLILGWLLLKGLDRIAHHSSSAVQRWSIRSLSRVQVSSLLIWTILALSSLLITLMPTLQKSLARQVTYPSNQGPLPSIFLFDIQEEQLEDVQALAKNLGTSLDFQTPLIRGRILRVNGVAFEKMRLKASTREEEREARFRNRGVNLTLRENLSPSEKIILGRSFLEFKSNPSNPRELVSVEYRYAQRLGLKLGDMLEFEIQGVPISAEIVNLRKVEWTSFQPNFFIVFAPGALNDAPKTYLASLPQTSAENREVWQSAIFKKFPNVSMVDVTRLIESLLESFRQIASALQVMAVLAALAGFAAVFSILRARAYQRQSELHLLKVLGATEASLKKTLTLEAFFLGAMASSIGALSSVGVGAGLSLWVFDSSPTIPPLFWLIALPLAFASVSAFIQRLAVQHVLKTPPQSWLRAWGE